MAPIVYNRRNKKASVAHKPEVQVHPRQQPQLHQEGKPQVTLEQTVELLRACYLDWESEKKYYHPRNDDEPAEDAKTDSSTSVTWLVSIEEVFQHKCLVLQGKNQNGNQTSRLSYLSSMVVCIVKNSWIGLTKWKESLISMRYQIPRKWNWYLSSWKGELQPGGNSSKFKELGGVKERSKIGARWSRKWETRFCLSIICSPCTNNWIIWSNMTIWKSIRRHFINW